MTPGERRANGCAINDPAAGWSESVEASSGSFWLNLGALVVAEDFATGGGGGEAPPPKAAETARLARRISLSCWALPERDAFLRMVRFLATVSFDSKTFYSLELCQTDISTKNLMDTACAPYSNRWGGGVNCFGKNSSSCGQLSGAEEYQQKAVRAEVCTCTGRPLAAE